VRLKNEVNDSACAYLHGATLLPNVLPFPRRGNLRPEKRNPGALLEVSMWDGVITPLIMLRKERVLSTAGQMFPESGSTEIDLRGEQYVRLWRYGGSGNADTA